MYLQRATPTAVTSDGRPFGRDNNGTQCNEQHVQVLWFSPDPFAVQTNTDRTHPAVALWLTLSVERRYTGLFFKRVNSNNSILSSRSSKIIILYRIRLYSFLYNTILVNLKIKTTISRVSAVFGKMSLKSPRSTRSSRSTMDYRKEKQSVCKRFRLLFLFCIMYYETIIWNFGIQWSFTPPTVGNITALDRHHLSVDILVT